MHMNEVWKSGKFKKVSNFYSKLLDHLCGAMFIHIQEIEETAMFFVPAILKRKLHILLNGRPLEYLVTLLHTELKKEPTGFQRVAYFKIQKEQKAE